MKNERRRGLRLQQLGTVGKKEKIGARGQEYALSNTLTADLLFKAKVVNLILSKDTEEALQLLSQHYKVAKPNLKVGMPKRHSKNPACYVAKKRTIHVSDRKVLRNPHVILHEFYHHLRNFKDAQRGIEEYAQRFAESYLQAYRIIVVCIPAQRIDHENRKWNAWRKELLVGSNLDKIVLIERAVVDSILSYAQMLHPREAILLLKGKVDKQRILVNDTQIPPLATHGNTFSTFPLYMLPIDFSIVGVAHSHPSGALRPSITDLNKFYSRIMVITAYPYLSEKHIAIFDREGKALKYEVV